MSEYRSDHHPSDDPERSEPHKPLSEEEDTARKHTRRRKVRRAGIWGSIGTAFLIVVLLVAGYLLVVIPDLPSLRTDRPDVSLGSIVYSADGEEIARFYREDRIWRQYREISPDAIATLLAAEDHRFYEHSGIDVRRVFSSAFRTVQGDRQGASTLSMQLSRNLYPAEIGNAQNLHRKTKEMLTALRLERNFEKHEIIEMYLNTVALGYNAFGVEAAARRYFNTSATDLTLAQAATLVGMLKGPSYYNPVRHPERAEERRDVVLKRVLELGYLDREDVQEALDTPLELDFQPGRPAGTLAPHFAEYVQTVVGEWAERRGMDLHTAGLRIHTTLDTRLQKMANKAVEDQAAVLQRAANNEWASGGVPFGAYWAANPRVLNDHLRRTNQYRALVREKGADGALAEVRANAALVDSVKRSASRLQAGFVAIDPADGSVKAWVGGTDHRYDQYDKVAQAKRQPGSAFKPFVYAAAVDFGFSPYTQLQDTLITVDLPGSNRTWTPRNAGGGFSNEMMTVKDALVYSKNTITTKLVQDIGPHQVASYARRMGIKSSMDVVPSIGLGTSEVSLLELTGAYVTLASGGIRKEPYVVKRIESRNGQTLETFSPSTQKALSSYTAYTVVDMLRGVAQYGTAASLRSQWGVNADIAGKTGTSQSFADGWFVAMHPRIVTGAWMGFNDRRVRFRTSAHGQGGRNALRVVGSFMNQVIAADPALSQARFSPPAGYVEPRPPDYYDEYQYAFDDEFEDWDAYFRSLDEELADRDRISTDTLELWEPEIEHDEPDVREVAAASRNRGNESDAEAMMRESIEPRPVEVDTSRRVEPVDPSPPAPPPDTTARPVAPRDTSGVSGW